MEYYMREATNSAQRIKDLNPGINITIVTNPGVSPAITSVFDMVRQTSSSGFPSIQHLGWMVVLVWACKVGGFQGFRKRLVVVQ